MSATGVELEPFLTSRVIGRALFRSALTAGGIAPCLCALALAGENRAVSVRQFLLLTGCLALTCLPAGVFVLVERAATRHPASVGRDLVTGLGAWILGMLGLGLALLEVSYLDAISSRHRALSLAEAGELLGRLLPVALSPLGIVMFATFTVCAVPTTIARVRGLDRGVRLLLVSVANIVLGDLLLATWATTDIMVSCVLVAGPAILLPLVFRLSDWLETRLFPAPEVSP